MTKIFPRRIRLFVPLLFVVVLLLTFYWSLRAPTFIAHEASILRLSLLAWWRNLPLIFSRHFLIFSEGQFRPLSYGLLAVVRTFVGAQDVLFWHIWMLTFHWLNAILVFLLVRHFSGRPTSAVFAGVVFCLHPLSSVVVNNIDYFHYVLGLSFYLGASLCYLSFVGTRRKGLYVTAVVLFVAGAFTSKVVFTLPLILGAYELLYRRSGSRTSLMHILPFVGISLLISPLWWFYKPHPLYYKYIEFPPKAGWYSFFSVVGATGLYAKGLLFGLDIPIVLHEAIGRIFKFTHPRFLLWGAVDIGALLAAGWLLRRKIWAGLGVLLVFCSMVPFASTAWNGVEEYISWTYLYFPLVGLAISAGGVVDLLLASLRRYLRAAASAAFCLIALYYGVQQIKINIAFRSAVSYWRRVLRLNPKSHIASSELGKAYLRRGDEKRALALLFSPVTKQLQASSLTMSRYYCARGDYLAAAIHLRMTGQEEAGLQFQSSEMAAAEMFYSAGALDYAEAALGRVLMANPYNLTAVERLVEIWLLKGYVAAAGRLIERASKLAPSDPEVAQMWRALEAYESLAISGAPYVVHPPKPSWLRYAVQGKRAPSLIKDIVRLSERHRDDPVIQMEAGICLVIDGRPDRALPKLDFATKSLPLFAHALAVKCWAAAKAGAYSQAEEAGRRALELDPQNPTVHRVLGHLFATLAGDPQNQNYRERMDKAIGHYRYALQLEPDHAATHNDLGNVLRRMGRLKEAVACYRRALRIRPDFAQAHNNLGIALAQQGDIDEAIEHYRRALDIDPDFAEAHNNLGATLGQLGKFDEAIVHFRRALDIDPDFAEALRNLVMALMGQRRFDEAIDVLRKRLAEAPDDLRSSLDLAWLLANCPDPNLRDYAKAVELAEGVCRATGYRDPRSLAILTEVYAKSGRFDQAVQTAQRALELAVRSGQAKLRKRIEAMLELYKAHRSTHK
ncbi:MAG TPA: tetratricopeptide repeat protein [Candidatus Latescibacteria bacterium]|nr:tetratricopeptide repeat protein [Candidatus Latescibacterota bacterium]